MIVSGGFDRTVRVSGPGVRRGSRRGVTRPGRFGYCGGGGAAGWPLGDRLRRLRPDGAGVGPESGAAVGEALCGHYSPVTAVAVGQRGRCAAIVSGGVDSTVRVWDLESGAAVGEPIRGHDRCGLLRWRWGSGRGCALD